MWGHGNGRSAAVAVRTSPEYYGASEMIRFKESFNPIATPWNPTIELRLKKIRNPIPMFAMKLSDKRFPEEFRVEVFDRENDRFFEGPAETFTVAWDMEKGDWVQPHGKGEIADFIFTVHREERKAYVNKDSPWHRTHLSCGATVEISFSNDGDGLIPYPVPEEDRHGGPLLPYEAPEDGYGPWQKRPDGCPPADMNHFFRVRTIKDQTGKIISAHYGKIYGDFQVGGVGKVKS